VTLDTVVDAEVVALTHHYCGMNVGDQVRIERDETRYPPKGTWPQFRGRTGTIVEINLDKRPHLTEYGVAFGKVWARKDRPGVYAWSGSEPVTWFKAHELSGVAAVRHAEPVAMSPAIDDAQGRLPEATAGPK
jgi:hypothetical protein